MMSYKPLAELLRPTTLDEYVGQEHLVGKGAILARAIESGSIPSMILWGPPGVGKTTLAFIIARSTNRGFFVLSAISSGVKEVREVIGKAAEQQIPPILFIDEIHRFSKSQQDSLLGAVERGIVVLIGATTENPSFEVITPLLSRCQVYILKALEEQHLVHLLETARIAMEGELQVTIGIPESDALFRISGGDARKLYNAIEIISRTLARNGQDVIITNKTAGEIIQQNLAAYDKNGEQHYDIISAFIKSMRGSDPNGAVYWLARMIEGGEDPLFIARRMVILASEDIGNANPNALLLASTAFDTVHKIGWPEGRIVLSQTAVYLACSPKSNASYLAIDQALELVRKTGDLPVPLHLRNAPTKLMKQTGYGAGYKYAHEFEGNFAELEFLPDALSGTRLFDPGLNPREADMRTNLKRHWKDKYNY
ncbi:MAG TPA: AAA family ATPase [Bacteroidales bacterium]|nr:MAG: AAA family ATPase [Bacteroidetes bacterium GWE2_42_24]OFY27673.1 MAG: AAA family ATPase [Bacteroidetes bacterium GWF2_43_11]PKP24659.1 MAG: AAA family ATPase [Bacteroidetes bacterium HGW-Bacteroidetes-22]HAQ64269.1 AAA family ATPase [Bacteroidales bacterium]HBZ66520.1 AAA family ATPase [Bacteroidales bacterium]